MNHPPVSRTILILYVSIGHGHRKAAQALRAGLSLVAPDFKVVTLDVFRLYPAPLVSLLLNAYRGLVSLAPSLWNYLYDHPAVQRKSSGLLEHLYRRSAPPLLRILDQFRPAAVACTQAVPCALTAHARRLAGRARPRLAAVPTDYLVHRYWIFPEVDLYLVPADFCLRSLAAGGVPRDKTAVTGIPVDPGFARFRSGTDVLEKYDLSPSSPRVLVMGAGGGGRRTLGLIRSLDALDQPFQILALAGRDLALHRALEKIRPRLRHPLRAFAFLDSVDELMETADVIVTKPGGLTITEALIKRLPMVLIDPLPGQEVANSRLLEERGAALCPKDDRSAAELVSSLISGGPDNLRLKRAADDLRRPRSAVLAARRLKELLDD